MDGKHDMCCSDGGVYISKISSVIGAYPCLVLFCADDEKNPRAKGIIRRFGEPFARIRTLGDPDFEGLFVDGRRGEARCIQDAVQRLLRNRFV